MSIHKRKWITSKGEPRETWELDYFAYDPVKKKPTRRRKVFETKGAAKRWYEDNVKSITEKTHVPHSQSITVADMADIWIDAVTAGRGERGPAEASTLRQYNYHKDRYIMPALAHVKLCDL